MRAKERVRNAGRARQSVVTRRAEVKLSALADLFRSAAGEHWVRTESGVLRRELFLRNMPYLESLGLVYNWENRFFSVNYNLQITSRVSAAETLFRETGSCRLALRCTQKGLRGKREYRWDALHWAGSREDLASCLERLGNPLITERLNALDIMEMELRHTEGSGFWDLSCESLIGSATWILIPPVLSMITPKMEECVKFIELFQLTADAAANNR